MAFLSASPHHKLSGHEPKSSLAIPAECKVVCTKCGAAAPLGCELLVDLVGTSAEICIASLYQGVPPPRAKHERNYLSLVKPRHRDPDCVHLEGGPMRSRQVFPTIWTLLRLRTGGRAARSKSIWEHRFPRKRKS